MINSRPVVRADVSETTRRRNLGVPEEAARVLILGESSHWDPNWLLTSDEYFRLRVRRNLDLTLDALRDNERVLAAECIFFLRMYWDARPERRDELRDLLNCGRLRLTGGGVTTPDTLLPDTEALLRDYQIGHRWLREHGITRVPRIAYLPDSFGCSPAFPSILCALGYDYAALTRIDGMFFPGTDYRRRRHYPVRGSSAECLIELGTQVFNWRGPDGAETLCHWNAHTYAQGDMIGYQGAVRWMGLVLGWRRRSEGHVARQIDAIARRLSRWSQTPYLFCPIGFDFNPPIPGLPELVERYNRVRYPETGTYVQIAALDDYLDLVACHRDRLPTLELDPNPYWMGFYASRPRLKQRCRRLARELVATEAELALDASAVNDGTQRKLDHAWYNLVVSNHHDFITGTAPDRVVQCEQLPWLEDAARQLESVRATLPTRAPVLPTASRVRWHRDAGGIHIETPYLRATVDARVGGCLTYLANDDGTNALSGPANDIVAYFDTGGLWRMGHEIAGGRFDPVAHASKHLGTITVAEEPHHLTITVDLEFDGRALRRRMYFDDSPVIWMEVEAEARKGRTLTCRFPTHYRASGLAMEVPGGVVERAVRKGYDPTFWAAHRFVHLRDDTTDRGIAVLLDGVGCVSAGQGALQWVIARAATFERAFGVLPIPGHPIGGWERGPTVVRYGVTLTASGGWRENRLHVPVRHWSSGRVATGNPDVVPIALKRADVGTGTVVRLQSYGGDPRVVLTLVGKRITEAVVCDALERTGRCLEVRDGAVVFSMQRAIESVCVTWV